MLSANVNGVRAAARRGGLDWLAAQQPDVVCLQEVRAGDELLRSCLSPSALAGWHVAHDESAAGHAGVAVLTRGPALAVRHGVGRASSSAPDAGSRPTCDSRRGADRVSAYVHTGEAGTERQATKRASWTRWGAG